MEFITKNARQTQKLGEKLAKDLSYDNKSIVVCLYGDLGSGKTTFIQGFAKGLGITKRILSPTFIVMREYPIGNKKYEIGNKNKNILSPISYRPPSVEAGLSQFFHLDLYRIEGEQDAESLGLKEIFEDSKNIVAIEWPEKIEKILPKNRVEVRFEYLGGGKRRITISM